MYLDFSFEGHDPEIILNMEDSESSGSSESSESSGGETQRMRDIFESDSEQSFIGFGPKDIAPVNPDSSDVDSRVGDHDSSDVDSHVGDHDSSEVDGDSE